MGSIILKKMILEANYKNAFIYLSKLDFKGEKDQFDLLFEMATEYDNISIYSFIYYLTTKICKSENYHLLLSEILTFPTLFIDGIYDVAVFHIKEAIKLSPSDITLKHSFIFLYGIPGIPISNNLFIKMSNEILKVDPNDKLALSVKREISLKDEEKISSKKEKSILDLILDADFNTIFYNIKDMKCNNLLDLLLNNNINLTFYSLILYMLERTKDTKYHTCAIVLLLKQYKKIDGAMEVGVYHFKELSIVDIDLKFLLKYLSIETIMILFNRANININDFIN